MPLKKARVKRAYKPRSRKVYKRKRNALAPGPKSFFPAHKSVTLKYMQSYYYNGDVASANCQMQLNSLYSPEGSSSTVSRIFTNAQPYYFDQIAPQYDNYVVTKAKMRVTYTVQDQTKVASDTQQNIPFMASLRDCDNNSTQPSDMQLEVMRPNVSFKVGNASNPVTLQKTWDIAKLSGRSLQRYLADSTNWGTASSSPSNLYYANAGFRKIGEQAPFHSTITIELWQTAVFMGVAQVSKS